MTTELPHLIEVQDYDDLYDLPVPSMRKRGLLSLVGNFISSLLANPFEDITNTTRKPLKVYKTTLGGHMALYQSLTTGNVVDIAIFNRYDNIIATLSFQDGSPSANGVNGLAIEDFLKLALWRLSEVNSQVESGWNTIAIDLINSSILTLEERGKERAGK